MRTLILLSVLLVSCGKLNKEEEHAGTTGSAPKAASYSSSFSFGTDTVCQEVYPGVSASKRAARASAIRLFPSSNCTGAVLVSLSAAGTSSYTDSSGVLYTVSGNNATGMTLTVLKE